MNHPFKHSVLNDIFDQYILMQNQCCQYQCKCFVDGLHHWLGSPQWPHQIPPGTLSGWPRILPVGSGWGGSGCRLVQCYSSQYHWSNTEHMSKHSNEQSVGYDSGMSARIGKCWNRYLCDSFGLKWKFSLGQSLTSLPRLHSSTVSPMGSWF